jgi:hypothetical protein
MLYYDYLGLLTYGAIGPRCPSGVPLVPMVFWALFIEKCAIRLAKVLA